MCSVKNKALKSATQQVMRKEMKPGHKNKNYCCSSPGYSGTGIFFAFASQQIERM